MSDKKPPASGVSPHALPLLVALVLPYAATTEHPGLALLPLVFLAAYRLRAVVYSKYYLAPLLALFIAVLESRGGVALSSEFVPPPLAPLLPLAAAVAAHYSAVSLSKTLGKAAKPNIEAFANGVSAFLDEKCFKTHQWPSFLYMKSERVLIALACIVKIGLAVAILVLLPFTLGVPRDVIGCANTQTSPRVAAITWVMFTCVCVSEILFHMAMFLSQNVKTSVVDSFALPVLCPSYWQWFFIASYAPTPDIWLPISIECVRIISVSFFRMQDKEDQVVSPLMSALDLVQGVVILGGSATGMCKYPVVMLYRLLSNGLIFAWGYISQVVKKHRTWSGCTKKIACRLFVPVGHPDIECHTVSWMQGRTWPEGGGPIEITDPRFKDCKATYVPELFLERQETKPDFEDPTLSTFITFTRKTKMPGKWVQIDVPAEEGGLRISEKELSTGLEGQFRVLHPLLDSKGLMRYFGDFKGKSMFAAKKYKKDPGGGWDMEEPSVIEEMTGANRSAALNRHVRLLNPYFQDCMMQEKAAEFGRAFNKVENLPVRKVEVLRAVVVEVGHGTPLPQLYLCEQFLDDSVPFRKFNNNDYVPGQQAIQNTPNMLSLFSYFHSNKTLVMCDIQGKKYKFTDPQFHSSDPPYEDDGGFSEDSDDGGRDWLHSDGGLELQKRVLVGFHKQQTLHSLCNRVWPDQMQEFNEQVEEWMKDEDFAKLLEQMEKSAKMYATYFNNLNPVMDASIGGPYVDADEELADALEGKGPQMSFEGLDDGKRKSMSMDYD